MQSYVVTLEYYPLSSGLHLPAGVFMSHHWGGDARVTVWGGDGQGNEVLRIMKLTQDSDR